MTLVDGYAHDNHGGPRKDSFVTKTLVFCWRENACDEVSMPSFVCVSQRVPSTNDFTVIRQEWDADAYPRNIPTPPLRALPASCMGPVPQQRATEGQRRPDFQPFGRGVFQDFQLIVQIGPFMVPLRRRLVRPFGLRHPTSHGLRLPAPLRGSVIQSPPPRSSARISASVRRTSSRSPNASPSSTASSVPTSAPWR